MGLNMTDKKTKGRPKGGKGLDLSELDFIRAGVQLGFNGNALARKMARSRSTIYAAIDRMRRDGSMGQYVLPVQVIGGADERA